MKITLKEVRILEKSLFKVTQLELPIGISYRLARLLKSCLDEIFLLEKSRLELVKKYGEPSPNKEEQLVVKEENEGKFKAEIEMLLEETVDIQIKPFSVEELGDINISAVDMMGLLPIIKEDN